MKQVIQVIQTLFPFGPMDVMGVGIIDFKNHTYEALEANTFEDELKFKSEPTLYFDLASLTKPLTNSLSYFLAAESFTPETILCLNHRGGLPTWGLLSLADWRKQILSYPIKESETAYSDFSAIRVMLELEKKKINQKDLCKTIWDKETVYWTDLPTWYPTAQYGYKNGYPNYGKVHDPNAYVIGDFVPHAGLFSTVDGLCRTLLNYQEKTDFITQVKNDLTKHSHRFSYGWDRVENPETTLAGRGCSQSTFGHLGFTGTSIWIDAEKQLGHVILTNATKFHWFDKANLNDMRRAIGEIVWGMK